MDQFNDFSPRIISHQADSVVHSRLLLVNGVCGSNANGDIQIIAHDNNFPTQSFPVRNGRFKALIHLSPGENTIKMIFSGNSSSWTIQYKPLLENPPLHLCIIVGSDSPLRYDDVPDCHDPPNLETAIRKLRLAGYLWQAYTASQMSSNGLGHRVFRLEESYQRDTLSADDQSFRSTATIRVLKSRYTTAQIRDPQRAQQNSTAENKDHLYTIALETIGPEFPGERNFIAALFLDSHYDNGLITGHAALGSGSPTAQYSLAIFGSHMLFSWPTCLENVVRCFMDERKVNTTHCAVDGEGDKYWIACNVGLGAMMHEVGHLFGCPHQRHGVMMRDYIRLNRSFVVVEPPGPPALNGEECSWHRLDLLRFRAHPCYALPSDPVFKSDELNAFGTDQGILLKSTNGVLLVEFYLDGDEFPQSWMDFVDNSPSEVLLSEIELKDRVGRNGPIKINAIALDGTNIVIDNVQDLLHNEQVPGLGAVWKSAKLGLQTGSSSTTLFPTKSLVNIRIHSGSALDGLEFFFQGKSFLFGTRGGSPHDFPLEEDEFLRGFGIRSGAWIDAARIITNKKSSEWFGNVHGGSEHQLIMPRDDYRVCGVYGIVEEWIMQIGLVYCISK